MAFTRYREPQPLPPTDAQMAADWWSILTPPERARAVTEAQTLDVRAAWAFWMEHGYPVRTATERVPRWR